MRSFLILSLVFSFVLGGGPSFLAVGATEGNKDLFIASSSDARLWTSVVIAPTVPGDSLVSATYVPSSEFFSWFTCSAFGSSFYSRDGLDWVPSSRFFGDVPRDCAGVAAGLTPQGQGVAMAYNSPSSAIDCFVSDESTFFSLRVDSAVLGQITGIAYSTQSQRWFALLTFAEKNVQRVLTWESKTWADQRLLTTYTLGMSESKLFQLDSGKETKFYVGGTPIPDSGISGYILTYDPSSESVKVQEDLSRSFKSVNGVWISPQDGRSVAKIGLQTDATDGKAYNEDRAQPTVASSACVVDLSKNRAIVGGVGNIMISTLDLITLKELDAIEGGAFGNPDIFAMATIPFVVASSSGPSPTVYTGSVVTPAGSSLQVSAPTQYGADWIVWGTAVLTPTATVMVNQSLQMRGTWAQYSSAPTWTANNLVIGTGATLNVTIDRLPTDPPASASNTTFNVTIPLGSFSSKNVSGEFQVQVAVALPVVVIKSSESGGITTLECSTTISSSAGGGQPLLGPSTLSVVVTLQQTCVPIALSSSITSSSSSSSSVPGSTTSPSSNPSDNGGLSTAALVGIILGSVIGAALIATIVIGLNVRRRRKNKLIQDLKSRSVRAASLTTQK